MNITIWYFLQWTLASISSSLSQVLPSLIVTLLVLILSARKVERKESTVDPSLLTVSRSCGGRPSFAQLSKSLPRNPASNSLCILSIVRSFLLLTSVIGSLYFLDFYSLLHLAIIVGLFYFALRVGSLFSIPMSRGDVDTRKSYFFINSAICGSAFYFAFIYCALQFNSCSLSPQLKNNSFSSNVSNLQPSCTESVLSLHHLVSTTPSGGVIYLHPGQEYIVDFPLVIRDKELTLISVGMDHHGQQTNNTAAQLLCVTECAIVLRGSSLSLVNIHMTTESRKKPAIVVFSAEDSVFRGEETSVYRKSDTSLQMRDSVLHCALRKCVYYPSRTRSKSDGYSETKEYNQWDYLPLSHRSLLLCTSLILKLTGDYAFPFVRRLATALPWMTSSAYSFFRLSIILANEYLEATYCIVSLCSEQMRYEKCAWAQQAYPILYQFISTIYGAVRHTQYFIGGIRPVFQSIVDVMGLILCQFHFFSNDKCTALRRSYPVASELQRDVHSGLGWLVAWARCMLWSDPSDARCAESSLLLVMIQYSIFLPRLIVSSFFAIFVGEHRCILNIMSLQAQFCYELGLYVLAIGRVLVRFVIREHFSQAAMTQITTSFVFCLYTLFAVLRKTTDLNDDESVHESYNSLLDVLGGIFRTKKWVHLAYSMGTKTTELASVLKHYGLSCTLVFLTSFLPYPLYQMTVWLQLPVQCCQTTLWILIPKPSWIKGILIICARFLVSYLIQNTLGIILGYLWGEVSILITIFLAAVIAHSFFHESRKKLRQ